MLQPDRCMVRSSCYQQAVYLSPTDGLWQCLKLCKEKDWDRVSYYKNKIIIIINIIIRIGKNKIDK